MKANLHRLFASCTAVLLGTFGLQAAAGVDPAVQAKIDAKVREIQTWAGDATIVKAVKAQNASLLPGLDTAASLAGGRTNGGFANF